MIRVGFDFDEPVYPWYDLAHEASIRAGIALPEHEPTAWAPHKTYGCSLDEWVNVLDQEVMKTRGGMYRQPFQPGVVKLINGLYDDGYEIHIITARGSFGTLGERVKEITKKQITKNGLKLHALHFSKDKVPVAQKVGLDWFVDDALHNYDSLDDAGINVWLLNERWNQPWNDDRRRVSSVEEYVDLIRGKVLSGV